MLILAIDPGSFWLSPAFGTICGALIGAALGGAIAYINARKIEHVKGDIAKQFEAFRAELQRDTNSESERMKRAFSLELESHKAKLKREAETLEKQDLVATELYRTFHLTWNDLSHYGVLLSYDSESSDVEKMEAQLTEQLKALGRFLAANELYIPIKLMDRVYEGTKSLERFKTELERILLGAEREGIPTDLVRKQSMEKVQHQISELILEFRKVVGTAK